MWTPTADVIKKIKGDLIKKFDIFQEHINYGDKYDYKLIKESIHTLKVIESYELDNEEDILKNLFIKLKFS